MYNLISTIDIMLNIYRSCIRHVDISDESTLSIPSTPFVASPPVVVSGKSWDSRGEELKARVRSLFQKVQESPGGCTAAERRLNQEFLGSKASMIFGIKIDFCVNSVSGF